MAKKYVISLDPREAEKLVKQYHHLVHEQQRKFDSLSSKEKQLFMRFNYIIDSCLPHVKKNPAIDYLNEVLEGCDSLEQYRKALFDAIENIENEPKKYKHLSLLKTCEPDILGLEASQFEDRIEYHDAVCRVLKTYIHDKNIHKTWQERSQRLSHFMGQRIPYFEEDNFADEAQAYFLKEIENVFPDLQVDDDLIDFILQYYNVDNLLSTTSFLQELYVQLDIDIFTFVRDYECKRISDCKVLEDGSLRFECAAHYFSPQSGTGVLMTERSILTVSKKADQIVVQVEELSVSLYDESVFKEFIVPVLSATLRRVVNEGDEFLSIETSLMRACAQHYWECKDAKSLRDELEAGNLDGERLFALAWVSDDHLSSILSDPLLLGQLCGLDAHLTLLQRLKDHTYNKSLKGRLECLQNVLSKLDPKTDYDLDANDKQTRIFMLAGLFSLAYSQKKNDKDGGAIIPDNKMIRYATKLITKKLKAQVDFDLAKYLGEGFKEVAQVLALVVDPKKDEPVNIVGERDSLADFKKEIESCTNNAVLVAKCHAAWEKDNDDPSRALLNAYIILLKSKPDIYVDAFLMLKSKVKEEVLQSLPVLLSLLQHRSVLKKLVGDEDFIRFVLDKLKDEFEENKSHCLKCLKILVDHLKKPIRASLLRDKKWQNILFSLLINDMRELALITKLSDKVEKGLWLLTLTATREQLLYFSLSLKVLRSKLSLDRDELRSQIANLQQDAKVHLSDFNLHNNTAKLIAQSAKLNDQVNIDEAESQTNLHIENAKKSLALHHEANKKAESLSSEFDLIGQQLKVIDEFIKILEEKFGSDKSSSELISMLYGYEKIEGSTPEDFRVLEAFSDFNVMKTVLISGNHWEILPAIVENTSLDILAVLVLVVSALNKKTYLPQSFIRRIQAERGDIDGVLTVFDACRTNPIWVLNLFNDWAHPSEKAVSLLKKANEYMADDFHANRDFLKYLCRIRPQHLTMYLAHIEKTSLNEWVFILNEFDELDELAVLYVSLSAYPAAENFRQAFLTQPFLDKVLLFVSSERINALINARMDCLGRARELSLNDPIFKAKVSGHAKLREKVHDDAEALGYVSLNNCDLDGMTPEFLGEWFISTFHEDFNVFHTNFLNPFVVKRMLGPSYNHTNYKVLPMLVRALQSNSLSKDTSENCRLVESFVNSEGFGVGLLQSDATVLLAIFQLNVRSSLAKNLRNKLFQSDELLLKLFIEIDESSLITLMRRDTNHFFVRWLISKNHVQLFSRRLYACERGSTETNNSLIGCVLADLSLRQLLLFIEDPNVSESLAFQLSHTVGKSEAYPLLLGILKSKVERKKACVIDFLNLFIPLNCGFMKLVSKQNNDLTNSAWADFLKLTLTFIVQAKLTYKEVRKLEEELSTSFQWKVEDDRVALVSENDLYFPCPQLYFLLKVLCKPNELLKEFMHPELGLKVCHEFMKFSPQEGELIYFTENKSMKALACYQQFYEFAQKITEATSQQRKSSTWRDKTVKAIFGDEELTPEKVSGLSKMECDASDEENVSGSESDVVYV